MKVSVVSVSCSMVGCRGPGGGESMKVTIRLLFLSEKCKQVNSNRSQMQKPNWRIVCSELRPIKVKWSMH